jgi:hypothetical protein
MNWVEIDDPTSGFVPVLPPETSEFTMEDVGVTETKRHISVVALLSTALQALQHLQGEVRTLQKELKKRPEPIWMKSKPIMITTIGTCPTIYDATVGCKPHQVSPNMCTWDCQQRVAESP